MANNRNKHRFEANYEYGKQSEIESKIDLEYIFKCSLNDSPNQFANFDYYNDSIMVELKDRSKSLDYHESEEKIKYNNRKIIDTLWFDKPKLDYAKNHWNERKYYVVWKLKEYYLIWNVDLNPIKNNIVNWYIEYDNTKDHGKGYEQSRDIVNVYSDAIDDIYFMPSSLHKQDSELQHHAP